MTSFKGALQGSTAAVLMALASVSMLVSYIDVGMLAVMLYRNLFSAIIAAAILTGRGDGYGTPTLRVALRGMIVLISAASGLFSSSIIGVGPATAILFTFPIFVYCTTLNSPVRLASFAGIFFCLMALIGIFLMLFSADQTSFRGIVFGVISALMVSWRIILDGKLTKEMGSFNVVLWSSIFVVFAILLVGGPPSATNLFSIILVFLASIFATFSQIVLMNAYARGNWSNVGIYLYLEIPAAAMLGYLIINEQLSDNFQAGLLTIFFSVVGFELVRRKVEKR